MNTKDINNISYRRVVNGTITLDNGKSYSPSYGIAKEGEVIKITCIPPKGITYNGKDFIIVDKGKYWFSN